MAPGRESDLNVSFRRIQRPLAAAPKVGNGSIARLGHRQLQGRLIFFAASGGYPEI